jgi:hypothetical protein
VTRTTAELSTELLRSSTDQPYARLRELLPERGVDVASDVLADLFRDDVDLSAACESVWDPGVHIVYGRLERWQPTS